MFNKKSQLTMFILIGIVILFSVIISYYISSLGDEGSGVKLSEGGQTRQCEIECRFQRNMDMGQCVPDTSRGKNKEQVCIDEIGDNGVYIDADNLCNDERFIEWICCCFNRTD